MTQPSAAARPAPISGIRSSLAVASGKGGVGKSTVSVNLAVALAATGARVGLLDADLLGASVSIMTGVSRRPAHDGKKLLPVEAHGLRLMSLGFLMPDGGPVIWRGPMVAGAVQQFLHDVEWGDLDHLVIDLPPGTGDAQLTLAQSLPLTGAVIVTTPQDVAMEIAAKALAMFQQLRVPILGIVENMSGFVCPHCGSAAPVFGVGGGRRTSERLGVPFLGAIPLDPAVCQASDAGQPVAAGHGDSAVAHAFRALARAVQEQISGAASTGLEIRIADE